MVRFSDVLTIVNGKNQSKVENPNGKYPIYGSGGVMGYADDYLCGAETVVIGRKGSINKPIYVEKPFWNVDTAFGLVSNRDLLLPKYLFYFCVYFDFEQLNTTVTIPSLTKANLLNIEMMLPSLGVQQEVVNRLSKVDELIALRKEQLAKLDQLVKSRFIELFGDLASPECQWRREKLVDACADPDDIKCGPFGTQLNKDEYQREGIAVWEIPQINSRFMTSPTHYLTGNKAKQLDAYSIKAGDIAMSRKGNVGKCAVFPVDYEEGIIHSDVLRIRVDSKRVLPIFMMYQLHYSGAVQHQIELVSSGAIMAGINVTKLKQIFVHIPPIELQSQFATFVEQTDKSKFDQMDYEER